MSEGEISLSYLELSKTQLEQVLAEIFLIERNTYYNQKEALHSGNPLMTSKVNLLH